MDKDKTLKMQDICDTTIKAYIARLKSEVLGDIAEKNGWKTYLTERYERQIFEKYRDVLIFDMMKRLYNAEERVEVLEKELEKWQGVQVKHEMIMNILVPEEAETECEES